MKIVEATIAVLIIIGVLMIVSSKNKFEAKQDFGREVYETLDEISRDSLLRSEIIKDEISGQNLAEIIALKIDRNSFNYWTEICELDLECEYEIQDYSGDVYVYERVIGVSNDVFEFQPKKIKLYIWPRG